MDTLHRYRIVIALDGSEYSEVVLEHALDQASRHDAPDLHVLTVVDREAEIESMKAWLGIVIPEGLGAFCVGRTDWRTRLHVRTGEPAEEIANLAGEIDADLIVIGRYNLHHPRHSIAERVVATAPCPTLVIGLAGHEVDATSKCAYCVAARAESDGERWFCAEHSAPERLRVSTLVPWSGSLMHGGPLW